MQEGLFECTSSRNQTIRTCPYTGGPSSRPLASIHIKFSRCVRPISIYLRKHISQEVLIGEPARGNNIGLLNTSLPVKSRELLITSSLFNSSGLLHAIDLLRLCCRTPPAYLLPSRLALLAVLLTAPLLGTLVGHLPSMSYGFIRHVWRWWPKQGRVSHWRRLQKAAFTWCWRHWKRRPPRHHLAVKALGWWKSWSSPLKLRKVTHGR
ncbi:hypothetical protein PV11_08904 [Exophiala sideris]|uniref:Uncharacterized protein n=1 Tax=Exophiala sideris TaxID=1016849 RepID=A0A0D1YQ23_9EURO|nr:hypothetical protein PV11_08904 [Exophiala sideris]